MFEAYKNRMAFTGKNVSEIARMQSNMVMEKTWDRDPNYKQVFVVKVDSGLPMINSRMELIDAKFNIKTYQSINSDEVAYMLQFRHGEERIHPEIDIGSYVYMADEDGCWKWWMIQHLDERPQFRQYQILECNWVFKWIYDGKIYQTLGVQRVQQSYNSGSWDGDRITFVDNITAAILPTNSDTLTINYNHRFMICNPNRNPPLVWSVSKIEDTIPVGLIKLKFTQENYDPLHDNTELMLCNYFDEPLNPLPIESKTEKYPFEITYNGTKPIIKVGGSEKIFTACLPEDNHFDVKWSISDGEQIYGSSTYDNYDSTFDSYVINASDRVLKIKLLKNYNLVGKILTITAHCANGEEANVQVEVIS